MHSRIGPEYKNKAPRKRLSDGQRTSPAEKLLRQSPVARRAQLRLVLPYAMTSTRVRKNKAGELEGMYVRIRGSRKQNRGAAQARQKLAGKKSGQPKLP